MTLKTIFYYQVMFFVALQIKDKQCLHLNKVHGCLKIIFFNWIFITNEILKLETIDYAIYYLYVYLFTLDLSVKYLSVRLKIVIANTALGTIILQL